MIGGALLAFRKIEQVPAIGFVADMLRHIGELGRAPALERECVELEAWRVKSLAELRGWLAREGQSLN